MRRSLGKPGHYIQIDSRVAKAVMDDVDIVTDILQGIVSGH